MKITRQRASVATAAVLGVLGLVGSTGATAFDGFSEGTRSTHDIAVQVAKATGNESETIKAVETPAGYSAATKNGGEVTVTDRQVSVSSSVDAK